MKKIKYTIALCLISMLVISACSKSKSPDANLNDPILGTWTEARVTTLFVDSTQSPDSTMFTDTTYVPGQATTLIFKTNHIVSVIDTPYIFVGKGNYNDANGQLVIEYVYNNRLYDGDTTTYAIHNDTLMTNLVISDPKSLYLNQTTYYIRQ